MTIFVAAANYLGLHELAALLVAGLATGVIRGWQLPARQRVLPLVVMFGIAGAIMGVVYLAAPTAQPSARNASLPSIFLYFLKIGSVLYGSGYVLLAFLQGDLVTRWHWLTPAELLDATAVGQVTPGPLFTTATFIGYLLGRLPGAIVATVGIFLPSFVFVAISGPLIPRLRRSPVMGAFLDGVNVASVALMALVTWHLGRTAIFDVTTVAAAARQRHFAGALSRELGVVDPRRRDRRSDRTGDRLTRTQGSQQEREHAVSIHFVCAGMYCQLRPVGHSEKLVAPRDVAEGNAAQQRWKLVAGFALAELALEGARRDERVDIGEIHQFAQPVFLPAQAMVPLHLVHQRQETATGGRRYARVQAPSHMAISPPSDSPAPPIRAGSTSLRAHR